MIMVEAVEVHVLLQVGHMRRHVYIYIYIYIYILLQVGHDLGVRLKRHAPNRVSVPSGDGAREEDAVA